MSNTKNNPPVIPLPPGALPHEFWRKEDELIYNRRLRAGYTKTQAEDHPYVGVALSGGGIRSATFCLGVFQSLAKNGLLRHVDYLSTVSGGGYFGSFLGRMFTREWVTGLKPGTDPKSAPDAAETVVPDRSPPASSSKSFTTPPVPEDAPSGDPREHRTPREEAFLTSMRKNISAQARVMQDTKKTGEISKDGPPDAITRVEHALADSQSPPLVWLRDSSNYLAPGGANDGAMDVSIYLRNWVSMLTVMLTLAFSIFLLVNCVRYSLDELLCHEGWPLWENLLAGAAGPGLWWTPAILLPVLVAAVWFVPIGMAYWLTQPKSESELVLKAYKLTVVVAAVGILRVLVTFATDKVPRVHYPTAYLVILGFLFIVTAGSLIWRKKIGADIPQNNLLDSTLQIRNRMAESLRKALLVLAGSLAFAILDGWGQSIYAVMAYVGDWHKATPALTGVLGLTALAPVVRSLALKGPVSPGKLSLPLPYLALAFSAVLALLLLTGVSFASHALIWEGSLPVNTKPPVDINPCLLADTNQPAVISPGERMYDCWNRQTNSVKLNADQLIQVVPADGNPESGPVRCRPHLLVMWVAFFTCAIVTWWFAHTIGFLNLSSYHTLYSSRIVRAYQGASNKKRWAEEAEVTSAEADDDIAWEKYKPYAVGGPLHLVNCTINCTVSVETAMESTTAIGLNLCIGPVGISYGQHHAISGTEVDPENKDILVRPYNENEPVNNSVKVESLPLGDWIGISGAAFTTGLGNVGSGRGTTLGTSLLCGLFNVRLGYWWRNAFSPSEKNSFEKFLPVQTYLKDEFTASFHMVERDHWYLSDGGHFENTAAYELIRRRVPFVILADCGADPDGTFDDLGNLARRVRIDFGAELIFLTEAEMEQLKPALAHIGTLANLRAEYEFTTRRGDSRIASVIKSIQADTVEPAQARRIRKHAAIAQVNYPPDKSGKVQTTIILVIKPGLSGDEPSDLVNYQINNDTFPQQTTAEQFYDEAQWESYRKLGEHAMDSILQDGWLRDKLTPKAA